jgi:hypothetical protein
VSRRSYIVDPPSQIDGHDIVLGTGRVRPAITRPSSHIGQRATHRDLLESQDQIDAMDEAEGAQLD